MADISLRAVTKRFGTTLAVDGVSLDVPDGAFSNPDPMLNGFIQQ